ncbi:bis(5'-nucleosyl)-tetraphosphatase (symmetrical) YqeK [Bacillus massiliigorillae]|uniref:bis(5'-nucleosyl)-tetraphosphatase (symmetrical) YqeK n=1 Tax=Bacillus massiliigorillae TaxID=1243664 RepID=UPI0003A7DB87|nr:bis(5'-nucleosyl)-tetraphosphatase (symmetrical) YqeK [Bacillus massiliigorillae]
MKRDQALAIVKEQLTEKRYVHTIGVADTAVKLAERYGANVEKAELAGIFHDYAKFRPKEEMRQIIVEQQMAKELLSFHHELWHAPVGAYLVQKEAGIQDKEVLSAILYHTTGRAQMTKLEKIVFLADYIEPGRKFPGVDDVRQIAKKDLDEAVVAALRNTINFLMSKNATIYPDTVYAYNDLVQKKILEE